MSKHQIHVFISHSWAYSDWYDSLASWIFEEKWSAGQASLHFRNYSVPKDDPIHNAPTSRQLQQAIYAQIAQSHVVVFPTGMYASHSKWIQKEIDGAKYYAKPILAVDPWGQNKKSSIVTDNADDHVGWNKKPIVSSLWKLYQGALVS